MNAGGAAVIDARALDAREGERFALEPLVRLDGRDLLGYELLAVPADRDRVGWRVWYRRLPRLVADLLAGWVPGPIAGVRVETGLWEGLALSINVSSDLVLLSSLREDCAAALRAIARAGVRPVLEWVESDEDLWELREGARALVALARETGAGIALDDVRTADDLARRSRALAAAGGDAVWIKIDGVDGRAIEPWEAGALVDAARVHGPHAPWGGEILAEWIGGRDEAERLALEGVTAGQGRYWGRLEFCHPLREGGADGRPTPSSPAEEGA